MNDNEVPDQTQEDNSFLGRPEVFNSKRENQAGH
jgi:hypothetical protein